MKKTILISLFNLVMTPTAHALPSPLSHDEIVGAIAESKLYVRLNLNFKHEYYMNNIKGTKLDETSGYDMAIYRRGTGKFFRTSTNVYDVLERMKIEVPRLDACRDQEGNAVDATIHAGTPDSICISSFRLQRKLKKANYKEQILGIVFEQLSRLFGANDAEATLFRKRFLSTNSAVADVKNQRASAVGFLHRWLAVPTEQVRGGSCQDGNRMLRYVVELGHGRIGFEPLRRKANLHYVDAKAKLQAMTHYLCANDLRLSSSERLMHRKAYDALFEGQSVIAISKRHRDITAFAPASGWTIRRIDSPEIFRSEYEEINRLLRVVLEDIEALPKFEVKLI